MDKNQHNFKAELILNDDFILANKELNNITLRVNNISQIEAYGIWFDVKIIDENAQEYEKADIQYSDSTTTDDSIGTIMSRSYKDIDISFAFNKIYKNNKDVIIQITIHDADNNTWKEELKFVLYKGTFDINVDTSTSNLKGYIRLPYNDQILAVDMAKGSITLPLLNEDMHYPLVLANSGALGGETKYSIGLNIATQDFSDFKNTGAYEDDDMEEEANILSIGDESIVSYIHYGDLDYWKITTPETAELFNFNKPIANAGVDQTITHGTTVTLDGSLSESDDNTISYEWKEGAILLSTHPSFTKSDFSVGVHTITLIITDNNGVTDSDTVIITVDADESETITKNSITYATVISPYTGKIWLDRNLGASKVCSSIHDTECYGDYYQWGRDADGHEDSKSDITSNQASSITNVGSSFILSSSTYNYDWAQNIDSDGNLRALNWNKTDGSSVCPTGYRVPNIEELEAETTDIGVNNINDAFNNFLKLPSNGFRTERGSMYNIGSHTYIWSTTISANNSRHLQFWNDGGGASSHARVFGWGVRCIKD
ncbi:MAG: PKD domain-containing protein [Campylobacterota bacterium]|nr:PKD domain-containing protein [Campylobacterota bacterium]